MAEILIKGLEMPKGELGAVPVIIFADGTVRHYFSHLKVGDAVPVQPHGGLIDADALEKQVKHDAIRSDVFVKIMCRYLENAPTIVPASED